MSKRRNEKYWAEHIMNNFTVMEAHKFSWRNDICPCKTMERECKNCEKRDREYENGFDMLLYCQSSRDFFEDFSDRPSDKVSDAWDTDPLPPRLNIYKLKGLIKDMVILKIKEIGKNKYK